MTDQTHLPPQTAILPDLDTAKERLSRITRTRRILTAILPGSARLRRDVGAPHSTRDAQNETVNTMTRNGIYF